LKLEANKMAKITVLGGCGSVGSVAVKALAKLDEFDEVVIADINIEKAEAIAEELGADKVKAVKVDALDPDSIKAAIKGSDLVLNTTGPFYKFVKIVLKAVIESGIDYIDVCDDYDVTIDILKMSDMAKEAGVTAVIGLGSSPGTTNLLAKFAAETLLDETDSIDIYHAHGGEPIEGEGVIGHRFHCMTSDVPMYLDGELKYVKFFEEDGIALQEVVDFHMIGGGIRVYPYPHPEQITLPEYIKCRRVTNKGTVLPEEYYDLTKSMVQNGLYSKEPLDVKGQKVVPYDFALAYIVRERDRILKEVNFGTQRGAVKIVVSGKKDGKDNTFIFQLASQSEALGEGTGIPAAVGCLMMANGEVDMKGVYPPEGCVDPLKFLAAVEKVFPKKGDDKSFEGVVVEHIDENGVVKKIDI
jgi:saccharopine dehydrogenase-like NADP-dependent oxidoreductase